MRDAARPVVAALCAACVLVAAPVRAADPTTPVYLSTEKIGEIMRDLAPRVNKETGQSPQRFGDSMFLMHREKTSGAEAHTESADFIIVNGGAGTILMGGKILNGRLERPGEIRGEAIEGGTPYPVKAGDMLYVPKAMPHQFQVQQGSHMAYTVVKVTPVE